MSPRLVDVVLDLVALAVLALVDHRVQADLGRVVLVVAAPVDLVGMHRRHLPVNLVSHLRPMQPQHQVHELTPEVLKQLARLYRPPHVSGGNRGKRRVANKAERPTLPRLLLAQLRRFGDWSERDQQLHDRGLTVARKRREHPRGFELDSFRMAGRCRYQRGDVVVQVVDEGGGEADDPRHLVDGFQ